MVIALVNHKGGVGKTTCTLNIGAGLQRMGKSVLLIDADAQANLTTSIGLSEEENITLYDIMREEKTCEEAICRVGDLDIIPAHLELSAIELELASALKREEILKMALQSIRNKYDYILIDCPPALDLCTKNALAAADEVYIPVSAEFLPITGLNRILKIIDLFRRKLINPTLTVSGVIITQYNKQQTICRDVVASLKEQFGSKMFNTYIRENVALKEYAYAKQDIFRYAPKSLAASDYSNLVAEIIERENTAIKSTVAEGSFV